MTPQEIAREAAEEFLADSFPTMSQFLTVEACHKARRDKVAALILSAAAKMVRESGRWRRWTWPISGRQLTAWTIITQREGRSITTTRRSSKPQPPSNPCAP